MVEIVTPHAERPLMPEGYGLPAGCEGLLAWADVEERLVASMSYWLATVRPDGRLSLASVMGPPGCQEHGTTWAR